MHCGLYINTPGPISFNEEKELEAWQHWAMQHWEGEGAAVPAVAKGEGGETKWTKSIKGKSLSL